MISMDDCIEYAAKRKPFVTLISFERAKAQVDIRYADCTSQRVSRRDVSLYVCVFVFMVVAAAAHP